MTSVESFLQEMKSLDKIESMFRKKMEVCTLIDYRVLDLVAGESKRLSALSDMRGTAPQGISKMCKRLKELGYINIEPDRRDGRAKLVSITQEGSIILQKCERTLRQVLN